MRGGDYKWQVTFVEKRAATHGISVVIAQTGLLTITMNAGRSQLLANFVMNARRNRLRATASN